MVITQGVQSQSSVSFKVLRLTSPTLMTPTTIPNVCEGTDFMSKSIGKADRIGTDPSLPDFALGELLVLPQSFGKIYLGETFTSYVSIQNTSRVACTNFSLVAEIQTKSRTIILPSGPIVSCLEMNERLDHIYNYEIKELGKHVLICSLEYTDDQCKQSYKKQYRFEVKVPLSVTHEFYQDKRNDSLYLKAEVSNLTYQPIYISEMKLQHCLQYEVEPLNQQLNGDSVFACKDYLNTSEKRVYLYRLTSFNTLQAKKSTDIGRLDIVWMTNLGDKGHLQTSALDYENKNVGNIKVNCDFASKEKIIVGKEFNINLLITNCSNSDIPISLEMSDSETFGLLWKGKSCQTLNLPTHQHISLPLQLTAYRTGIQILNGIIITNIKTMERIEYNEIGHVLVYNKDI